MQGFEKGCREDRQPHSENALFNIQFRRLLLDFIRAFLAVLLGYLTVDGVEESDSLWGVEEIL